MIQRWAISLILLIPVGWSAGCAGMYTPKWDGPGTAPYQRALAQRYDPYPEPDAGPEVLGGRPIGFERPPAETFRSRRHYQSSQQRQRAMMMQPMSW